MTLSPSARETYRAKWRMLAQGLVACAARPEMDPGGLADLALEQPAKNWVLPTEDKADAALCSAAAAFARAYALASTVKRRTRWSDAGAALGAALGDLLDASEPPIPARGRRYHWQDGED